MASAGVASLLTTTGSVVAVGAAAAAGVAGVADAAGLKEVASLLTATAPLELAAASAFLVDALLALAPFFSL